MYTVPWAVTTFVNSPVRAHEGSYLPCPSSLWSRSFLSSFSVRSTCRRVSRRQASN